MKFWSPLEAPDQVTFFTSALQSLRCMCCVDPIPIGNLSRQGYGNEPEALVLSLSLGIERFNSFHPCESSWTIISSASSIKSRLKICILKSTDGDLLILGVTLFSFSSWWTRFISFLCYFHLAFCVGGHDSTKYRWVIHRWGSWSWRIGGLSRHSDDDHRFILSKKWNGKNMWTILSTTARISTENIPSLLTPCVVFSQLEIKYGHFFPQENLVRLFTGTA